MFYQTIADLQNAAETEIFFRDFLSKMEQMSLAKRLMTAYFLTKGESYNFIKKKLKVSSATIASIDKTMKKNKQGFSLAFQKIEAENWAKETTIKINQFIKKIVKKGK